MSNDIQIASNIIDGRQGWAYICNSRRFSVFVIDLDKKHEYEDFKQFGRCNVAYNSAHHGELTAHGTVEFSEGKWQIGGGGVGIHSGFDFSDRYELLENANTPTVKAGEVVALAFTSKVSAVSILNLFKVGKVDPHCMTIAKLTPLTDDEMKQVKIDADKWCNR